VLLLVAVAALASILLAIGSIIHIKHYYLLKLRLYT
jgi:hypothetical protein